MLDRLRKNKKSTKKVEYFTVMILPGPNSRVRKFSISKTLLKNIAISVAVVAVISTGMLIEYFRMQNQMGELNSLRAETVQHRQELKAFAGSIIDMRSKMDQIKELDDKLRKLAHIKDGRKSRQVLGIGGSKETPEISLDDIGSKSHGEVMDQMRSELDGLAEDAKVQATSMNRLADFFEHRNSILAVTPNIWPVRGFLTSTFGYRMSPITGHRQFHEGLDIANRIGAPVVAPSAGTVAEVGYQAGYGRFVKIQHGFGMVTLYGHLSKQIARPGQRVKRGQLIGLVGNSGSSTGPHLHYEVRINGMPTNPKKYL